VRQLARGRRDAARIPLDAAAILRTLAEHRVDYVLIGGLAVQAHGHTRTTQDIDIVPAPAQANLSRLRLALAALHAHPAGRPDDDVARHSIPEEGVLSLDTRAGGVDIHPSPPGAPAYPELRSRALELDVADVRVAVAGLDDLISMKRAGGQPIDIGDIVALTEPGPTGTS
jgi:hypothetical protein